MKKDKDNIELDAVEDHNGIMTIRGGGGKRDWNGIHYKQGMSAKNVGSTKLSVNVATIPPGGVARAKFMPYVSFQDIQHQFKPIMNVGAGHSTWRNRGYIHRELC